VGKGTGLITACLGRELKAQLVEAVRNARTTQSRFVRQAIARSLRSDGGRGQGVAVRTSGNEREILVHAYLPQSVAEWYSAAARSAGTTRTSYLRAELIAAAERDSSSERTTTPAPGAGTVGTLKEALVKSNAGLAAIERSVAHMTRALDNAHPEQIIPQDRESLAAVGRVVTQHLELVSRALQAIRAPRYGPSRRGTAPKSDRWP
jgi:hypothetical protein